MKDLVGTGGEGVRAPKVLIGSFPETSDSSGFLVVRLNDSNSAHVLLSLCRKFRKLFLDFFEALVDAFTKEADAEAHGQQRNQGQYSQAGINANEQRDRQDGGKQGIEGIHDPGPENRANGTQVIRSSGHEVAGWVLLEEAQRELLKMSEEVIAEIEFDSARHPDQDLSHEKAERAFNQRNPQDEHCIEDKLVVVQGLSQIVDS